MTTMDGSEGERLHYSGMTHAHSLDGTTATEKACDGDAPTGHEKVSARSIFGADDDESAADMLHRMQPGIAASDGVGAGREKAAPVRFAIPKFRGKKTRESQGPGEAPIEEF